MRPESFDSLQEEVLANRHARIAAFENELRRELAEAFDEARESRKLSLRALAKEMDTSLSQVQRVLHKEVGGSLTLGTICRAADALGREISIWVRADEPRYGTILDFGKSVAWKRGWSAPRSPVSHPLAQDVPHGEWIGVSHIEAISDNGAA